MENISQSTGRLYVTTTLPYVNADPHIGFALELVQADVLARFARACGREVFFNTGTDEHGQKIYQKALEMGEDPQTYVDHYAKRFDDLKTALNASYNNFIRTTDVHHISATQEFWKRCSADIEKKSYEAKYCVGCEMEKTDSELEAGRCPLHPDKDIECIEEENYFFRFSKYGEKLLELYHTHADFVVPAVRMNEIKSFVDRGLQDFSISRLAKKMPWGVPVPGDSEHVMYVWFDALVNYISAIGWPEDMEHFETWWPVVQFAGKDNLRQQSAMWVAMLMSAGITPPKQIVIHGFITSGGMKMSKSMGNVVNPFDMVDAYGTDALRYFLLREISSFEDGDFTEERFIEAYNANLANGLGNVASRVMKMAETHLQTPVEVQSPYPYDEHLQEHMAHFALSKALDYIWDAIRNIDLYVSETEPYKLIKTDPDVAKSDIMVAVRALSKVADWLVPFLPETAKKIQMAIKKNTKPEPLFIRK